MVRLAGGDGLQPGLWRRAPEPLQDQGQEQHWAGSVLLRGEEEASGVQPVPLSRGGHCPGRPTHHSHLSPLRRPRLLPHLLQT